MKTQHLREDKTCLNCGTEVPDRFCSHCGQENVETKESFGHLVSHFFQDITHYDSKLLLTLKNLFFYPGQLTKKYVLGHRADYVNPIRLYVFTSFLFFLILGSLTHGENPYLRKKPKSDKEREKAIVTIGRAGERLRDTLPNIQTEDSTDYKTAANVLLTFKDLQNDTTGRSAIMYDSLQQLKPAADRDGFILRNFMRRYLEMHDKYGENRDIVLREKMWHHYPKLMFLLLPFFALLMKMVFFRRKLYYADHAIFAIHLHTFIFILYMVAILLNMLIHNEDIYAWFILPVFLYFVTAARNMYDTTWASALGGSFFVAFLYGLGTLFVTVAFTILMFAIA